MNITGLGTALENPGFLGKILLLLYRYVAAKALRVFFQNEGNLQFMQKHKIALQNAHLLPGSGVNLKEHPFCPYPSEKNGIRFLAVLRIMKDKGIEEYLYAVQKISEAYSNVHFELVGEYEEESRSTYEPMIQELESQGCLTYYGHIDNVPEVMANCHILIHPSYHEGLSNVCLEAAACGRGVLTTDVPGCRETVTGQSGILFPARSKESLLKAVQAVLSCSPGERRNMGIHGHQHVEEHFNRQIVICLLYTSDAADD